MLLSHRLAGGIGAELCLLRWSDVGISHRRNRHWLLLMSSICVHSHASLVNGDRSWESHHWVFVLCTHCRMHETKWHMHLGYLACMCAHVLKSAAPEIIMNTRLHHREGGMGRGERQRRKEGREEGERDVIKRFGSWAISGYWWYSLIYTKPSPSLFFK